MYPGIFDSADEKVSVLKNGSKNNRRDKSINIEKRETG